MLTIKRIMKRKEKRSCRLILACCALLLFISVNAFAQQQVTVTGNVKDEKGEPIIGANVIVKGTGTGSVTNVEGDFSLANVQNGSTLEISFIGYLNQDVKVNGTKPVSIILKEDTKMLDEVVVVGYGVQRKSDMTGAVASVNTKTLENRPQTNIIQSLQGAEPMRKALPPRPASAARTPSRQTTNHWLFWTVFPLMVPGPKSIRTTSNPLKY